MAEFPVIPFSPGVYVTLHGERHCVFAPRMHGDLPNDHVLQRLYQTH